MPGGEVQHQATAVEDGARAAHGGEVEELVLLDVHPVGDAVAESFLLGREPEEGLGHQNVRSAPVDLRTKRSLLDLVASSGRARQVSTSFSASSARMAHCNHHALLGTTLP